MKNLRQLLLLIIAISIAFVSNATTFESSSVKPETIDLVINKLKRTTTPDQSFRIERCVKQTAALWQKDDGNDSTFIAFCSEHFVTDTAKYNQLFNRLSYYFESLWGNMNKLTVALKYPSHIDIGEMIPLDLMFSGYDVSSHINDDFFQNKIAFVITLNFPSYNLTEKQNQGNTWTRKQWADARIGDIFTSRVPAEYLLKSSEALSIADAYIADYNIYMGYLLDNNNKTLFSKDLKLISHWNLRDEIKSNYVKKDSGLLKQRMIYEVMKHIILQDVPKEVINSGAYQWNPFKNKMYKDGKEIVFAPEKNVRYTYLLNNFHSMQAIDKYSPQYPTYIQRQFEQNMEMSQAELEKLFINFISSPLTKEVAGVIKKRLGRDLEPFDMWYDGFKSRSTINEDVLTKLTSEKYTSAAKVQEDLPYILVKLGFKLDIANEICSHIAVDPSRGPGHAWESDMKEDKAHLRTRIGKNGMNYKGYNIAVHEFGHNVEQTISLHNVDYYFMKSVPNTAFTEALAFVFQARDLDLLGVKDNNPDKESLNALDNFWNCFEMMGVSLLDMRVWKWMYEHPKANADELKETVVSMSKEIWNTYYAPVYGVKDQPILAIYSHMIDAPLYLSAYPVGTLIKFQIEKQLKGKNFADEVTRMYSAGKLAPQVWMKNAVGHEISIDPLLEATKEGLLKLK